MAESISLLWMSPAAESALLPQQFKVTRGESVSLAFERQTNSTRAITGATITVRFATSQQARTSLKITAPVSGTAFTAALSATNTASLTAAPNGYRRWFMQAFDETAKELLSWGWMTLYDNTDLLDSGGIPLITATGPSGVPGPSGTPGSSIIDGGAPDSIYSGTTPIDGGGP